MNDLINRRAAIDALMEIMDRPNHADFLYTDEICKTLNDLPSVQPEPHPRSYEWIPCSEMLPEDGTNCLVSVRCSEKVVVVDMATYSTDISSVDEYDFYDNRGESG